MQRTPLRVTFDTNAYSPITRPQLGRIFKTKWPITNDRWLSIKRRIAAQYLNWCIRRGRIVAGIPEAVLSAEALPNEDRIALILAIGTRRAATPPVVPSGRLEQIREGFRMGFRALHYPRIAYGDVIDVQQDQWAIDKVYPIEERQARASKFIRHFNDHALQSFRDFGEKLSIAHGLAALNPWAQQPASMNKVSVDRYLWRHGLNAEDKNPLLHPSKKAFLDEVRNKLSAWADFDVAAAHYSYGYDYLCTDDQGRQPSNIFGSQHAGDVVNLFGVHTIRLMDLAKECWRRFKLPILKWHSD